MSKKIFLALIISILSSQVFTGGEFFDKKIQAIDYLREANLNIKRRPAQARNKKNQSADADVVVDKDTYKFIRSLGVRILQDYSPQDYIYIGIGRSPTPIIALFEGLGLDARSIPLSDLGIKRKSIVKKSAGRFSRSFRRPGPFLSVRSGGSASSKSVIISKFDPETVDWTELNKLMYQHFENFLPNETELKNKKILFIDYAHEGQTVILAKKMIDNFLNSKNISSGRAEYVAIQENGAEYIPLDSKEAKKDLNTSVESRLRQAGIKSYKYARGNELIAKFYSQEFDEYSKYGSFSVLKVLNGEITSEDFIKSDAVRPEYMKLVKEMGEFSQKDISIKNFILSTPTRGSGMRCSIIFN